MAYFSGMPRRDWPKAVDARRTTQPEEGAISASSESEDEGASWKEGPPPISEKVQGKRVATDEPAQKKRKTMGVAPRKPSGISLGGDQTTWMQSVAMSEWSDDDGALVAPPSSTEAPLCNTRAEVQSKGGEEVPKQEAEERPTAWAARPPFQGTWVDPRAMPRCSKRQHWFRTVYREATV